MRRDNSAPRLLWQIVAATLCRIALNTARRFVYPFAPALSRDLQVPLTAITSLIAVNQAASLAGLFVGPMADRWGYRKMMRSGLLLLAVGIYAPTLADYFIGDDFDLIQSFWGKPPSYFFQLLYSNESGDVWKSWGIDPEQGQGFLRPVKIWLLKLQWEIWGTRAFGFHLTSLVLFAAIVLLVRALVTRFPDLRLAREKPTWGDNLILRGPTRLPLEI